MHMVERSLVIAALLLSGVLTFAAENHSRKEARIIACGNQPSQNVAVETVAQASGKKSVESFVANPYCKVCHLDFDEEELALQHEVWGIGCERCHGESFRHRSDEANVTPPEIMYLKERVNPSCMSCHPRQDIQDTKDHDPILEAGLSSFEEATPSGKDAKKYCTDCHGSKHRVMRVRAAHWDKATGALLKKDK
jgi:Zn finger protein HypA/HybF involved in hydrogenase expression